MRNKLRLFVFSWIFIVAVVIQLLLAQTVPNVRYIYDEAGQLIGSVDANGNAKIYNFDGAGNLVSIERLSTSGSVDIFFVEPNRPDVGVRPGTSATIYGIGFSDLPTRNQVAFNGVAAVVATFGARHHLIRSELYESRRFNGKSDDDGRWL